jgi:hypothetical protein
MICKVCGMFGPAGAEQHRFRRRAPAPAETVDLANGFLTGASEDKSNDVDLRFSTSVAS